MTGKNDNVNYKPMFLLSAMFMGIIGSGFMNKEELPIQGTPSLLQQKEAMKLFVDEPVKIKAGDLASVHKIASVILGEKLSPMATAELISKKGLTSVYQLGDYEVTLENFNIKKSSQQEIFVSFRKANAVAKENVLVLNAVSEENDASLANDVVSTYRLKVAVSDTTAPVIKVSQNEDTITEGDEFNAEDYFESAVDDVDGNVEHTAVSNVDSETPGVYTVTYEAKDKAGNKTSADIKITVEEKPEEELTNVDEYYYSGEYNGAVSVNGNAVVNAALSQLGKSQDCTMLVTNSLAAAGINFHSAPAGYMQLGTIVSAAEAQPGDIIYYADGGVGVPHVAVYLGGNEAVHGGWTGHTTVVNRVYGGSGPVFIHIAE